jgi:DNA primase
VKKSETLFGHHLMCNDFDTVVLVESPLDAVRLWQCCIPSVAAMGAGVSNAQVTLLARHYTTVILALDDDPAGHAQQPRIAAMLRKRNTAPLDWRYDGRFKDIGDYEDDRHIIDTYRKTYRLD